MAHGYITAKEVRHGSRTTSGASKSLKGGNPRR
nr:MAG TPA: hypothetical protein [Bacteriophage sp.]